MTDRRALAADPVADRVLAVLDSLARERRAVAVPPAIHPAQHLEDDFGLNSLERIELAARLARECGTAIPPDRLADAVTVGDLVTLAAGGTCPPRARGVRLPSNRPWIPADTPRRSRTFTARVALTLAAVSVLAWRRVRRGHPDQAREALHAAAGRLVRSTGTALHVQGLEHLQRVQPAVLVANHQSYIDTAVLLAALPLRPTFVANERLPGAPLLGRAVAAADYLVVDRGDPASPEAAVGRMVERLRKGESLLLFPEGTLAPGPELLPMRLGAFATAVAAGRPVVPITIRGTRQMLPYDTRVLGRAPLSVVVHPPIAPCGSGWPEILRLAAETERRLMAALTPR